MRIDRKYLLTFLEQTPAKWSNIRNICVCLSAFDHFLELTLKVLRF